ncbi:MAG: rod shape-determining protein MreD, partial [Flavobacteriaceae bacterium]
MNNIIKNIISAIAFILIQCLILNNINFLNSINPLLYIYIIVYFPIINNRIIFILFSFLYGLSIDIFTDSAAVHAAACVTLAYFRPIFLKLIFGMTYIHQVVKFKNIDLKQN